MDKEISCELKGKKVLIFGLGVEGNSLVRYLIKKHPSDILIFDQSDKISQTEFLGYQIIKSSELAKDFKADIVFRSPGVKISTVRDIFGKTEISSATNIFMSNVRGTTIGVTGTKGKSTTVNLLKAILVSNKKEVFLGGNIGNSPLDFVDETTDHSFTILELSSFQLQDLKFKPQVAIFLPVTTDHLNYHETLKEYIEAKKSLVSDSNHGQIVIAPEDQQNLIDLAAGIKITYGKPSSSAICLSYENGFKCGDRYFSTNLKELSKRLKIPEVNLACSLAFCFALNLDFESDCVDENFQIPNFRMQKVVTREDIDFYNDSASTNPLSVIEAVKLMDKDFVLICGGSSKGLSYKQMGYEISKSPFLKKVYVIGETGRDISNALLDAGYDGDFIISADSVDDALRQILQNHNGIEAILFSSGSASFDQFKNYCERGKYFNKLVDKWPNI
jgi:UDP-N-acetylmuramoylalanine--D-glutamate ligase